MMKVVIIETVHAQYGITQSELFHDAEQTFFATAAIKARMQALAPGLGDERFILINSVDEACERIIRYCNEQQVNLLSISPLFKDFESVLRIAQEVKATTALTVHNLNYWFNARYRTWKYYRQRRLKQRITHACDHILVDDGILDHIRTERRDLLRRHNFLMVPFTLFHPGKEIGADRAPAETGRVKVVLPGSIYAMSRDYGQVLEVIDRFAKEGAPISFSFAGPAVGAYGLEVVGRLEQANEAQPGIARFYPTGALPTAEMFMDEMSTADLLLSPLHAEFRALGTTEYYGRTKVTGAMGDMITFRLPGLLPAHIPVPPGLTGSVFHFSTADELHGLLAKFLHSPDTLQLAREKARSNSLHYTAEAIRAGLTPLLQLGE
ncbi:MAG TPA: hypothetical protein PLV70_00725 [Flavobacteriales bacterium]|nr:hypothetical protein [Flavobacteriales bacterium]HRQ83617.1 hypothetical protein [Flavobacteriales bacterium]